MRFTRFLGFTSMVLTGAVRTMALAASLAVAMPSVHAQTAPAPQPVESQPLPPVAAPSPQQTPPAATAQPAPATDPAPTTPPAVSRPPVTAQPAPVPTTPPSQPAQSAAPASAQGETLVPPSVDPSMPDKVELPAKPAALLRGASTWDDGYDKLTAAFTKLHEAMAAQGIRITGKPVAVFLGTDDLGFRFEAQLPIERAPAERPASLAADIRFGMTPSGSAWRFIHRAPYEDIDTTYEAITAYLDQRGIDAKEAFIEEYVTLGQGPADDGLEINIFVQPR